MLGDLGSHVFAKFLDVWQCGKLQLLLIELLSFVQPLLNLSQQLALVLGSFGMWEQLELTMVSLIVVQSLDFIVSLDCVSPNEEVDVKRLIERVLKNERVSLVGSDLDSAEVNEAVVEDLWLRDVCRDGNLDVAHDVSLDSHCGLDVLDHALDPVALNPSRHRH